MTVPTTRTDNSVPLRRGYLTPFVWPWCFTLVRGAQSNKNHRASFPRQTPRTIRIWLIFSNTLIPIHSHSNPCCLFVFDLLLNIRHPTFHAPKLVYLSRRYDFRWYNSVYLSYAFIFLPLDNTKTADCIHSRRDVSSIFPVIKTQTISTQSICNLNMHLYSLQYRSVHLIITIRRIQCVFSLRLPGICTMFYGNRNKPRSEGFTFLGSESYN